MASSTEKQNYHNKKQIEPFDDESSTTYGRCTDDGENERFGSGSSDDDLTVVGHVSTRELIGQREDRITHTKSTVSMLRKQFENVDNKKKIRNLERQISEKFFKRSPSPVRTTAHLDGGGAVSEGEQVPTSDYYVIEKTKVYKLLNNNNKETVKGMEPSSTQPTDKISKIGLSKRSHSNGDIKRIKRSPSHDVIAEEPSILNERTKSVDQMTGEDSDDVEYRSVSASGSIRRSVRTVDDILQQERFSKCYSEYSISDLLDDLPDDGDFDFASLFNKN